MSTSRGWIRAAVIGSASVVGLTAGAATAKVLPSITVTRPACLPMRPPVGRRVVVGIAEQDKTVCVSLGDRLLVELAAAPKASPWRSVSASPGGVLRRVFGVTTGASTTAVFFAAHPGTTHLLAERRGCHRSSSAPSCEPARFEATVVVLGTHATVGGPEPLPGPQPPSAGAS